MSPNPQDDDVIATKNRIVADVRAGRIPSLDDVDNVALWVDKQAAHLRQIRDRGLRASKERGE